MNEKYALGNTQANNAKIYSLMFDVYEKVRNAKESIDALIAGGADYYKGYKIVGGMSFEHFVEAELEGNESEYFYAASKWQVTAEHGKAMRDKVSALCLEHNYATEEFTGLHDEYICKATHDFLYPISERCTEKFSSTFPTDSEFRNVCEKQKNPRLTFDMFKQACPDDFYAAVRLTIGKDVMDSDISRNEYHAWEEKQDLVSHDEKRRKAKSIDAFNLSKKQIRKLHAINSRLIHLEVYMNDTKRKILRDFDKLQKDGNPIFNEAFPCDFCMNICYDFSKRFHKKIYDERMAEHDIKTNLDLHSLSIGSDDNLKDDHVLSWVDPPFLQGSPFDSWYLCYAFHCLISHTHLKLGDILKMKPKKFSPYFEIYLYEESDDAVFEK